MQILVDADACPRPVREIVLRAAQKRRLRLTFVANQVVRVPLAESIDSLVVPGGPDEADDRIVALATAGDLVVTADVPLADRVVTKGATALDPRGQLLTADNIKERLATRDLLDGLRSAALVDGGPPPYGPRESQAFADALNRFLQAHGG